MRQSRLFAPAWDGRSPPTVVRSGCRPSALIAWVLLPVLLVAGCGVSPVDTPTPAPVPTMPVAAANACQWARGTPLAFAGETSLGELGISAADSATEKRRLPIYVTADPNPSGFREFCAVRPGGAIGGTLPEEWELRAEP